MLIEVGRILCAVDLSPHSDVVVEAAVRLARQFHAQVTLITVQEDGFPYDDLYDELKQIGASQPVDQISAALHEKLVACAARHADPHVEVEAAVLIGSPAKTILAEASERGADAIVLGRIGRSRVEVAVMGSVVQKVIQNAPCHVLVVKMPDSGTGD